MVADASMEDASMDRALDDSTDPDALMEVVSTSLVKVALTTGVL